MSKIFNNISARSNGINSVIYWHNFFSDEEIEKITKYCGEKTLQPSTISMDAALDANTRVSNVNFHNLDKNNSWIFDRLNFVIEDINNKFYQFDLYGYDFFQYSEYKDLEKGKYDFHMDMFMNDESYKEKLTRKLSLSLLLNDPETDFEGGEFHINSGKEKDSEKINLKKGTLIAFPSFMIHKVNPVTKGTRKSIVVWVQGPKFK